MGESLPIIVIVIAGILVILALVALRTRAKQREGKLEGPVIKNKKVFFAPFIAGLTLALTGAFFMFDGDILGEDTTGIATVIGIVGISLIATSNLALMGPKRSE